MEIEILCLSMAVQEPGDGGTCSEAFVPTISLGIPVLGSRLG